MERIRGVSEAQVDEALRSIEKLLERPPVVHSFNPEYGGPVWYIP